MPNYSSHYNKKIMNHLYIAVGSIRQNVKICDIGNKILRTGDKSIVKFRF